MVFIHLNSPGSLRLAKSGTCETVSKALVTLHSLPPNAIPHRLRHVSRRSLLKLLEMLRPSQSLEDKVTLIGLETTAFGLALITLSVIVSGRRDYTGLPG